MTDATAHALQNVLVWLLLPLWMLAGFGDWLAHRGQHIEANAGVKESLMHFLMLFELGPAIAAVFVLEPTAALFLWLVIACAAHEATVWWDLSYSATRRTIPVHEQWLHSLQLVLPWAGLVGVMLLHREQALALFGLGEAEADWGLRLKSPGLPAWQMAAGLAAAALLVVVPFLEELARCLRQRRLGRGYSPLRSAATPPAASPRAKAR